MGRFSGSAVVTSIRNRLRCRWWADGAVAGVGGGEVPVDGFPLRWRVARLNQTILFFPNLLNHTVHDEVFKNPCVFVYEFVSGRPIPSAGCLSLNELLLSADLMSHCVGVRDTVAEEVQR